MNESRATFTTSDEPCARAVPSIGPPWRANMAGRFLFCGTSVHAIRAIVEALGGLTIVLRSFASEAEEHRASMDRMIADMREIIGPPSNRFMRMRLAHEAIRSTEMVSRMKPPTRPHWLIRHAPWARHWGLNLPRGWRRTRSWT